MTAGIGPTTVSVPGNEQLFRELIPDIVGYCVRRLRNREDAADAAAEVFLVLWRRRADTPPDPVDMRRWAFGIAHKTLLNIRRTRRRQDALAAAIMSELTAHTYEDHAIDLDLEHALASLTPRDRDLVLLVAWEGFSVADAARTLGLRPDAGRARYARARARLRERLEPQ